MWPIFREIKVSKSVNRLKIIDKLKKWENCSFLDDYYECLRTFGRDLK